ncbi:MAG: nitrous oxide-stimulated promoter family protein [Tannerella sp.]|jgi:predicted amidophosphoribosyltransferase|nr:nitrous oxide-stimulated promoter family protein [Tannerella sp.]
MNNREKKTVSKMLRIYCRFKHGQRSALCPECRRLEDYAYRRLEHCKFGEDKMPCQECTVHCYKPEYREQIRVVMRYAGQRMLFFHPVDAIRHLWETKFRKRK